MNAELLKLVKAAGAPEQVMDELWFHAFCEEFAHVIMLEVEKELDQK
jgi:hypothetical protein